MSRKPQQTKHSVKIEGVIQFSEFLKNQPGVNRVLIGESEYKGSHADTIGFCSFGIRKFHNMNIVINWCRTNGRQRVIVVPEKSQIGKERELVDHLIKELRDKYSNFQIKDLFSISETRDATTICNHLKQEEQEEGGAVMQEQRKQKISMNERLAAVYYQITGLSKKTPSGFEFRGSLRKTFGITFTTYFRQLKILGIVQMQKPGSWLINDVEIEIVKQQSQQKPKKEQPDSIARTPVKHYEEIVITIPGSAMENDEELYKILMRRLVFDETGKPRQSVSLLAINLAAERIKAFTELIESNRKIYETLYDFALEIAKESISR